MPYNYWDKIHEVHRSQSQRRMATEEASYVSPDQAALMSELTNFYPTVPSGVLRPLAMEGYGPDDPVTMSAVTFAAFQEEEERGEYGARWGDDIRSSPPTVPFDEDLAQELGYVSLPIGNLFLPESDLQNPRNIDEKNYAQIRQEIEENMHTLSPGEEILTSGDTPVISESAEIDDLPAHLDNLANKQLTENEIKRLSTEQLMFLAGSGGWLNEDGFLRAEHLGIDLTATNLNSNSEVFDRTNIAAFELFDRLKETYPYYDIDEDYNGDPAIFFETDPQANPPAKDEHRDRAQQLKNFAWNTEDPEELAAIRDAYVAQAPATLAAAGGLEAIFDYDYAEEGAEEAYGGIPGVSELAAPVLEKGLEEIAAPGIRSGLMALDSLPQELQGVTRTVYDGLHGKGWDFQSQSNLGIALPRIIRGEHVDLGSGALPDPFDPENAVNRERMRREASYTQINGHSATAGRILANAVGFQPDTTPYQVLSGTLDAGIQLADPTVLSKASKISQARRVFYGATPIAGPPQFLAGAFSRPRLYVNGQTARKFLEAPTGIKGRLGIQGPGQRAIKAFTEAQEPYDIRKITDQIPEDVTYQLAQTRTTDETFNILESAINSGKIRETTQIRQQAVQRGFASAKDMATKTTQSLLHPVESARQTGLGSEMGMGVDMLTNTEKFSQLAPTRIPRSIRMFQKMPGTHFDMDNPTQVTRTLDRMLMGAKATDDEHRTIYNMVAKASAENSRNGLNQAIDESLRIVNKSLKEQGIYDDEARSLVTRTHFDGAEKQGYVDEISGMQFPWKKISVGGRSQRVHGPHLPLEHIGKYRSVPDARAIRRLTSKYNFLTSKGGMELLPKVGPRIAGHRAGTGHHVVGEPRLPVYMLDQAMQNAWKPAQLIRIAWPLRVLSEGQARIASADLSSTFNHPMDYISWVAGSDTSKLAKLGQKVPGIQRRGIFGVDGELIDNYEQFHQSLTKIHGNRIYSPDASYTGQSTVFARDDVHQTSDFNRAWAERIGMLNNDPLAHKLLTTANRKESVQWLREGAGQKYLKELQDAHPGNLKTSAEVNRFVRSVEDYAKTVTNGNSDLLNALTEGKLNGQRIFSSDMPRVNPKFQAELAKYRDQAAPTHVFGDRFARKTPNHWNVAVDRMFSALMGVPENKLARAPVFRQNYWKHANELITRLDKADQATVLKNAEKSNLSAYQLKNLQRQIKRSEKFEFGDAAPLKLEEYNDIIKSYALEDTRDLLYDISERGQFWDAMRIVVPFGDAWQEVITRWAKLATFNGPFGIPLPGSAPATGYKTMKALQDPDVGELIGAPDGEGFFWENEFGDQVFVWPGSKHLTESMTGMPVPLSSPVQGLNMFGTFMPGMGPAVQVPAAFFMQGKPDQEFLRRELFPFGMPDDPSDVVGNTIESFKPTWFSRAEEWLTTPESDRSYANTVMQVDAYLASTGDYGDTPEEKQRRLSDARAKARNLFGIRSIASFILPAPPSPEHMIEDESGTLLRTRMVSERYAQLIEETGSPDEAIPRFIDEFGWNALLATRPKSVTRGGATIESVEGAQWVQDNPDLAQDFPYTHGFFAPQGEFDYETFQLQFSNGERRQLTPEEYQLQYDNFLGNYHYNKAKQQVAGRNDDPALQWLRDVRHSLGQQFPGYSFERGVPGLPQRATTQDLISELQNISGDSRIAETEAGEALNHYLGLRSQVESLSFERHEVIGWQQADSTKYLRDWLEFEANRLVQAYPQFMELWTSVLSNETRGPGPQTFEQTWEQ